MATAYTTALDKTLQQPNIAASDEMDDPGKLHDEVHTNHSQAIIQIEEKLGFGASDASDASTNQVLVKQANGQTNWAAAPASTPTAITVADTTDTSCSVALFESATGDLAPKTDGGVTYNAGTGTLTATAFAGSAALTGTPTAPTAGAGTNTTQLATTAFVQANGTSVLEVQVFS